jgi:hypothetical protein
VTASAFPRRQRKPVVNAAGDRYLDIEVIAGPHVDWPDGHVPDLLDAMTAETVARVRRLRDPLARGDECALMVSIGAARLEPAPLEPDPEPDPSTVWNRAVLAFQDGIASRVLQLADGGMSPDSLWAVSLEEVDEYAYVLVIGMALETDERRAQARVRQVATTVARNAPLYVIGVTTADPGDAARWQRLGASVVLHGPSGRGGVLNFSRTPLDSEPPRQDLTMVPCPSFRGGEGSPGMVRLRIDAFKGRAEIAFHYDSGSDLQEPVAQVVAPLVSASRVSPGERRLHRHVSRMIRDGLMERRAPGASTVELERYQVEFDDFWNDHGYVKLCTADREVGGLEPTRTMHYLLLVVLREGPGGYDLLLSNHSPIRESSLAEWNTLLLPAFQRPHTLLEHLRDDVMRQAAERAEDLERGEHARNFEAAIDRILANNLRADEDVWSDQVREITTMATTKISPTTGCVTRFEYHFVTLLPLVDRDAGKQEGETGQGPRDADKLIAWLNDLDAVEQAGHGRGDRSIAIESLHGDGGGLRFSPGLELKAEMNMDERARVAKVPPGAVWFPIGAKGDRPWLECPSMVARNADVMSVLGGVLDRLREGGDQFPPDAVLGRFAGRSSAYETELVYPFDAPSRPPGEPAGSTCEALSRVTFAQESDLHPQLAYPRPDIRRVYLVRRSVGARGRDRDAVLVVEASVYEDRGPGFEELEALGRLRPVQRYVLKAGMRRVREIQEQVVSRLDDPWGFARVRKGGAGDLVSITPPIVEQLHEVDWGERGSREYVLTDGNHRVVNALWCETPAPLPAVAIVSQPEHPYYALPFGDLEWGITAATEVTATPPQEFKYLPRTVTEADVADPEAWASLEHTPELRFRRYFRDLSSGFGSVGGQGGRMTR